MSTSQSHTSSSTHLDMRQIEEHAIVLRQRAGVGPLERIDPQSLVHQFNLELRYPRDIHGLPTEILDYFSDLDPKKWSGMGKQLPNGRSLILLNPSMTIERENVTILEEVAHIHYGHQPSQIITLSGNFAKRIYMGDIEDEAYQTAAACLIPSKAVAQAVWRGETAEDLAVAYNASPELAEMRIKRLNLWSEYSGKTAPLRRAS